MADQVFEIIDTLRHFHVPEILAVLGALLVLIDYFFPTDWPAHVGYVLFSAAMFFVAYMYGLAPVSALAVSLGLWLLLSLLHRALLHEYLENAPGTPGYEAEQSEGDGTAAGKSIDG